MITHLSIESFKSVGPEGIDLAVTPLTVLVGPNGAGKSTIIEAVEFASMRPVGPTSKWGSSEHARLVHRYHEDVNEASITIGFDEGQTLHISIQGQTAQIDYSSEDGSQADDVFAKLRDQFFGHVHFLSALRGHVAQTVSTGRQPEDVGRDGQFLVELLALIFGGRRYENIKDNISRWAARFNLPSLNAGFRGSDQLGSDYRDERLRAVLELDQASSGSRQILALLAQVFWAPSPGIFLIEEPEISLHPRLQVELAELMAEALRLGHQVITTTHSSHFVMALRKPIAEGRFLPGAVTVVDVTKQKLGTSVRPLTLTRDGSLRGWIPSFKKVEQDLLRSWIESLPQSHETKR